MTQTLQIMVAITLGFSINLFASSRFSVTSTTLNQIRCVFARDFWGPRAWGKCSGRVINFKLQRPAVSNLQTDTGLVENENLTQSQKDMLRILSISDVSISDRCRFTFVGHGSYGFAQPTVETNSRYGILSVSDDESSVVLELGNMYKVPHTVYLVCDGLDSNSSLYDLQEATDFQLEFGD